MGSEIVEAEIVAWLRAYDGPRFHAVLSDPPYALLSIARRFGPGQAAAQEGSDGRWARLSAGFMGQEWDSFSDYGHYREWVAEWARLLIERALYPGAVCMFFGGTRTFHHLGLGLEMGGFEIVDTMMWLHGQGFPKSHNVDKYLDDPEWGGYGTALKPAWEPIFLCRAPRGEQTLADLATEYGTGELWIDGGRIRANGGDIESVDAEDGFGHGEARTYGKSQGVSYDAPDGRWPANLVLSHADQCVRVGEAEVEGRVINRFTDGMKPFGEADGEPYESEQMPPETVERWACVPECPVRQMDDQVVDRGYHSSGQIVRRRLGKGGLFPIPAGESPGYALLDNGAANPSRFFYTAKASPSEKDKGLEDFYWKRTDEGWERVGRADWKSLPRRERARGCIHPTVKPLDLLRYLAKLFKPPDSVKPRLLVPFAGSGSEVIAARQAGWHEVVGVEKERDYCEIADARVTGNLGMFR